MGRLALAVEDHPKYDAWSQALDELKAANDAYREAQRTGQGVAAAKRRLDSAQAAFYLIADQIG
jgi:hypothetical protein